MIQKVKRIIRGACFLFRWLFWEKPRGVDFSLRQKKRGIEHIGNHGYALTQKKSFCNILSEISIENGDFIDIGAGKGGCLYYCVSYPFHRIAGIEIEDSLFNIAVNSFTRLGLMDRVELYHQDATRFDKYHEFNIYYLFNPFEPEIYISVLEKIFSCIRDGSNKHKRVYLICYGASVKRAIEDSGLFVCKKDYVDPVRQTSVCIWKRICD